MRKIILIVMIAFLIVPSVFGTTHNLNVRVNGVYPTKQVSSIRFGDNGVTLIWNDNTQWNNRLSYIICNILASQDISKALIFSCNGIYHDKIVLSGLPLGSNIQIYDIQERVVYHGTIESNQSNIDISNLNIGIYLIQSGNIIFKFVKV